MSRHINKKNQIVVSHFHDIVIGYLNQFKQVDIDKSANNGEEIKKYLETGLSSVLHIFKITLQLTKNVDLATTYAEKGIIHYTEYIEQLNKNGNLSLNTLLEITTCIYSKTLGEIYTGNGKQISAVDMLTNTDVDECLILTQLNQLCYVLIWQSNPAFEIQQYMEIIFMFFKKYCSIDVNMLKCALYIKTIQQKFGDTMTFSQYCEFLEELYKHIWKNWKKIKNEPSYFNEKALHFLLTEQVSPFAGL
jgi:hypothetical protein